MIDATDPTQEHHAVEVPPVVPAGDPGETETPETETNESESETVEGNPETQQVSKATKSLTYTELCHALSEGSEPITSKVEILPNAEERQAMKIILLFSGETGFDQFWGPLSQGKTDLLFDGIRRIIAHG